MYRFYFYAIFPQPVFSYNLKFNLNFLNKSHTHRGEAFYGEGYRI
jgi:hypothetical protein